MSRIALGTVTSRISSLSTSCLFPSLDEEGTSKQDSVCLKRDIGLFIISSLNADISCFVIQTTVNQ